MICGRCLHSKHLPCGQEVVDLLHERVTIDFEKVSTMKSVLTEVRNEILTLKDEAENSKENYKKNADKCMQECMELGTKIKQRVDELTSFISDKITKKQDENQSTYSRITKTCNENLTWCVNEERKIEDFVDKNFARYLFLMSRRFENVISEVRSCIRETKHKNTFKWSSFKENKVILKCMFEDFEEVCEHQEEVTGSDDGNDYDFVASTNKINKTRLELTALLNQVKQDLDRSEKGLNPLGQFTSGAARTQGFLAIHISSISHLHSRMVFK
ncbi:hypothetical protein MAR_018790, partial [Mya arenaria]